MKPRYIYCKLLAFLLVAALVFGLAPVSPLMAQTEIKTPISYIVKKDGVYHVIDYANQLLPSYMTYRGDPNHAQARIAKFYFEALDSATGGMIGYLSGESLQHVDYSRMLIKYMELGRNVDAIYAWFNGWYADAGELAHQHMKVLNPDLSYGETYQLDENGYRLTGPVLSNDATVKSIKVLGESAQMDTTDDKVYRVTLPSGTILADLTAGDFDIEANHGNAVVSDLAQEPGDETEWTFIITAEDGTTQNAYRILLTVAAPEVDKSALKAVIDEANDLTEDDWTDVSWALLEAALAAAEDVYADDDATQEDVDDAKDALRDAIDSLAAKSSDAGIESVTVLGVPAEVDATDDKIYHAELPYGTNLAALTSGDFDIETSDTNALVSGLAVNPDDESEWTFTVTAQDGTTQEVYTILLTVAAPAVDKSALKAVIDEANDLTEDDWTEASWDLLEAALTAAEGVYADDDATQEDVDDAKDALRDAIDNLVAKSSDTSVESVMVLGVEATADPPGGTGYYVELPAGKNLLDLVHSDIAVFLPTGSEASVEEAVSTDGGATWTFVVTAENGTQETYTVHVTVAPDADKSKLQAAYDTLAAKIDEELWWTELGLKTALSDQLTSALQVLNDVAATQAEVDAALEALLASAFRASKGKTGLETVIPLYENAGFEGLTPAQQGASEAIGFINMAKIKVSTYGTDDKPTDVQPETKEAIDQLITDAVAYYLEILEGINDASTVQDTAAAIEAFIDYAIEVYGSWAEAKENVSELQLIAEDFEDTYKLKVGVAAKVLKGKGAGYGTLAEVIQAALAPDADKSGLKDAIDEAILLTEDDYTGASWTLLEEALDHAQQVYADEAATQEEVDDAEEALRQAISNLVAKIVTQMVIKAQPTKLAYVEDQTLDLSGLQVTLTYNDGLPEDVAFEDFDDYGITAAPVQGTALTIAAHHGKPVTLTHPDLITGVDTDNLTVTEAQFHTYKFVIEDQAPKYWVREGLTDPTDDDFAGLTPVKLHLAIDETKDKHYQGNVRIQAVGFDGLQLWAKDSADAWYDINVTGWGPPSGFVMNLDGDPQEVYVIATKQLDNETATLVLLDVSGEYGASDNKIISQDIQVTAVKGYYVYLDSIYTEADAGEDFDIDLYIESDEWDDFFGATIEISFDHTRVSYQEASQIVDGFFIGSTIAGSITTLEITGASTSGWPLTNGLIQLAKLDFKVKDAISPGQVTFSIGDDPVVNLEDDVLSTYALKGPDLVIDLTGPGLIERNQIDDVIQQGVEDVNAEIGTYAQLSDLDRGTGR
ncbi:MAG: hypothetical protein WDA02_04530, partial [Saccharofermentanales bacterium]